MPPIRIKAKRNKYRAAKVRDPFHGKFDSKAEYARYLTLVRLEAAGEIGCLLRQVAYPLKVGKALIGTYVADFVYLRHGKTVIEDVKGVVTAMFRWKAKHVKAQYDIDVEIYPPPKRKARKKRT